MLRQIFMKSKISSPILSIRFITTGVLFILIISPKFVSAGTTIQQIDSLQLLIPKDIKINIFARDTPWQGIWYLMTKEFYFSAKQ